MATDRVRRCPPCSAAQGEETKAVRDTKTIVGIALVASLLLAACAPSASSSPPAATGTPATGTPPETSGTPASEAPGSVTGNVDVHGSSTVAPISTAVAEDFQALNPDWAWFVGDEGTGAGFGDFFCTGDGDVSDASRPISEEEAAACEAAGVTYAELYVGIDGIAVITAAANTAVECLTFADLYALLGAEADASGPDGGPVANWNDAETLAHELGSTTDLPDAQLSITAPGDESGTYDSFIELALGDSIATREEALGLEEGALETLRTPGDIYVASPNDNVIIDGIAGFPTSLGFVGFAYAEQNLDRVRVIPIDGGDGCVEPSTETVADGSYPISRPLFIYPSLTKMADNAAIAPFIDYYLSDEGIANVAEVGYVAIPAEDLEATRATWDAASRAAEGSSRR
jgi:phosphate transport system substrate-binding protein